MIHRLRHGLVVLVLVLSALGTTKLKPIEEEEEFLPSDHSLRMLQASIANTFGDEHSKLTLQTRLTWGIADIDRSGTSGFRPESVGSAVLDEQFDLRKKEAQQHILNTCESVAKDGWLVASDADAVECWLREYKQWRTQQSGDEDPLKIFDTQQQLLEDVLEIGHSTMANGSQSYKRYLQTQLIALA